MGLTADGRLTVRVPAGPFRKAAGAELSCCCCCRGRQGQRQAQQAEPPLRRLVQLEWRTGLLLLVLNDDDNDLLRVVLFLLLLAPRVLPSPAASVQEAEGAEEAREEAQAPRLPVRRRARRSSSLRLRGGGRRWGGEAVQPLRREQDAAVARWADGRQDAVQRLRGAVQVGTAAPRVPPRVQPHLPQPRPLQQPQEGTRDAPQEGGSRRGRRRPQEPDPWHPRLLRAGPGIFLNRVAPGLCTFWPR